LVTKYFCDCCKQEVPTKPELKKLTISAIVEDNICDDPFRTCASLHLEMCRQCFMKYEPLIRKDIEELPINLTSCSERVGENKK